MVMQPSADFLVGGSNSGRAHMAAAAPMAVDQQGFELPTEKSAVGRTTIRPWVVMTGMCIPTAWSLLTTIIISCLGVCYANDTPKGGYMTPALALDLTTSLRGDCYFTNGSVTRAPLPDPSPSPSGISHDPPPPPAQAKIPLAHCKW